jgi:hypothetical protein
MKLAYISNMYSDPSIIGGVMENSWQEYKKWRDSNYLSCNFFDILGMFLISNSQLKKQREKKD